MAWLPAQFLYVAAQFVSTDPTKQALTAIRVRPAGKGQTGIIIDSTDGNRAFRVKCSDPTWYCDGTTFISAKPFKKRINYGRFVAIDDAGSDTARILGGKNAELDHLLSVPYQAKRNFSDSGELFHASDYPNVDQIWPDRFTNEPKNIVAFNATLLKDFLAQVERYSWNGNVKMQCNDPNSPLYFTSEVDSAFHHFKDVVMEFLLMPVALK